MDLEAGTSTKHSSSEKLNFNSAVELIESFSQYDVSSWLSKPPQLERDTVVVSLGDTPPSAVAATVACDVLAPPMVYAEQFRPPIKLFDFFSFDAALIASLSTTQLATTLARQSQLYLFSKLLPMTGCVSWLLHIGFVVWEEPGSRFTFGGGLIRGMTLLPPSSSRLPVASWSESGRIMGRTGSSRNEAVFDSDTVCNQFDGGFLLRQSAT